MKDPTLRKIKDVTLRSAHSKEKVVRIYELSDMNSVIQNEKESEVLRSAFLQNKVQIKQMTNFDKIMNFTKNSEFIDTCMSFRFIPPSSLTITDEILLFDDIVAIYNPSQSKYIEIKDQAFANMQKELFDISRKESKIPYLDFDYRPAHALYMSDDFFLDGKQIIVYPDSEADLAYSDFSYADMQYYLEDLTTKDPSYFQEYDYMIAFIWSFEGNKMIDIRKHISNSIDAHSGPLSECRTYKNGVVCTTLGSASGNTLMILGLEEKARRQHQTIEQYLFGPSPHMPDGFIIQESFFKS